MSNDTETTVQTTDSRVESAEDARAWMVEDDELQDDEELEGSLFCPECVTSYVGDGEVHAVSHEGMLADAFCTECGVFLGDD